MKSKALLFGIFLLITPILIFSQSNLPASGGEATGTGTVSYSVGQIFYTQSDDGVYSSSLGVQQPFEISIVLSNPDFKDIALSLAVFPNPTTDLLNLKAPNYTKYNLSYSLHDINGRQIEANKIRQITTKINLQHLQSAIYMLNISDINQGFVKTFRIVKN